MSQLRKVSLVMLCAAALVALVSASAQAQGGGGGGRRGGGGMMGAGGGGGGLMLLSSEQVQKELELVDDQKQAIEKLQNQARDDMRAMFGQGGGGGQGNREERQKKMTEEREKNDKQLQTILLPQQYERLKQIELQVQGAGALAEKDVATAVGLSDDQQQKLTGISEQFQQKRQELFQGGGDRQAMRPKIDELRKAESDQMLAVLTDEQKSKFESMKGKIIEIDRSQLGFGAGGRRGGQGGGGQAGANNP